MITGIVKRKGIKRCPVPKSTFTSYMDEGFMHYRAGKFRKALFCFDRAIELDQTHRGALVSRSQCYVKLGNIELALRDAQTSYDPKNPYIVGLFQYAEALYSLGSFEKALVAFHCGCRLRNDKEGFRIGVQKCVHAIDTAIADKASTQVEDFHEIIPLMRELEAVKNTKTGHCCIRPNPEQEMLEEMRIRLIDSHPPSKARSGWVAREALGEMYRDKDYLSQFVKRPDVQNEHGSGLALRRNANDALSYLATREEFWRVENPMYSRKYGLNFNNNMVIQYEEQERIRKEQSRKIKMDAAQGSVLKNLGLIQHALAIGRAQDCKLECERTLRQLSKVTKVILPRKAEFVCQIYHFKGLALIEMKNYDSALLTFQDEHLLATQEKIPDFRSRALDFMAKCYAYKKCYTEAGEVWESRLPLLKTSLEKAYVFHEIGRSYFAMGRNDMARYFGKQCLEEADKLTDNIWTANARILLGQVDVRMTFLDAAQENFELAEKLLRAGQDKTMLPLISEALHCIKVWMEKQENTDYHQLDRSDSNTSLGEENKK